MEEVTLRIVEVDGVLADIRPVFNALATALLDRPVEVGECAPPHTITRLGQAAGLSVEQIEDVKLVIADIRDFWFSVPEAAGAYAPDHPVVFHVTRVPTRGQSVLRQTIDWLDVHGYKNPIVWVEEE